MLQENNIITAANEHVYSMSLYAKQISHQVNNHLTKNLDANRLCTESQWNKVIFALSTENASGAWHYMHVKLMRCLLLIKK